MYLSRAGAIENIESLIRQKGHNPNELLKAVHLRSAFLRDPEVLISYTKLANLLDYCAIVCEDPLFGIHLAQMQSPLVLGELATLLIQQPTLRKALSFSQAYIFLHAQGLQFEIAEREGRIDVRLVFNFTNDCGLKQLIQLSVSQQFEYTCFLMAGGKESIEIHLIQRIQTDLNSALGRYNKNIISGSHFNGVSFPASWMDVELGRNTQLLDHYLNKRIAALNEQYPEDLPSQVRYLCSNLMVTGECTLEKIAEALDFQPRSLQRKLKRNGSSFSKELQTVRYIRARQYLRDTHMPVTDIALNLGYAESAVFCRNFKKWSGVSPRVWRTLAAD